MIRQSFKKIIAEQSNEIAELRKKVERLERRIKKIIDDSAARSAATGALPPKT